ncbi:carboxypeptidase regulatory-like domain-containing protein [Candidatus Woesearchaeota archaeon]|nr:carboxypeptidase regulatory-like domain-containing protein [Candidatus Woesearchaeota archaeon]
MKTATKRISKSFAVWLGFIIILALSAGIAQALIYGAESICTDGRCNPQDGEDGCTCPQDCGGGCSTSTPENGGSIHVEMDLPDELNEFGFVGGSGCRIDAREIDGWGIDDTCSGRGYSGMVIDVNGRLSDGISSYNGDCDKDARTIIEMRFGTAADTSGCGGCSLRGYSGYSLVGDLLCSGGTWYLCSSSYHQGKEKIFTAPDGIFWLCRPDNNWYQTNKDICNNEGSTCEPCCEEEQGLACSNGHCCPSERPIWDPEYNNGQGGCINPERCGDDGENPEPPSSQYPNGCCPGLQPCGPSNDRVCRTTCCGNSYVDSGEMCEYTPTPSTQSQSCSSGSGTETRACTSSCQWGSWGSCTGSSSCGNGQIDSGEQCDGSNFGSRTCRTEGYSSGSLYCYPPGHQYQCLIETQNCASGTCGNGQINGNEDCDGSNLNGQTCQSRGYSGGTLSCSSCTFDESGCTVTNPCTVSVTNSPNNNACWTVSGPGGSLRRCGSTSVSVQAGTNNAFLDFGSIPSGYTYRDASTSSNYPNCPSGGSMSVTWNFNSICTPESDSSFCSRYGKNCGSYTDTDNCGNTRTANCGPCLIIKCDGYYNPGNIVNCGTCGTKTCQNNGQWGSCSDPCQPTKCDGYYNPGNIIGCGSCGTKTCQNNGQWGSCSDPCNPQKCDGYYNPGDMLSCGICGTKTCRSDGTWPPCSDPCSPQPICTPNTWSNTGSGCGSCGTQQRYCGSNGQWTSQTQCIGQGSCSPSSTRCSSSSYQSCNSGCNWQGAGNDNDGDGTDSQCGDSQCDNAYGVTDSTKTSSETSCADSLDNDCDGRRDCQDTDCAGQTGPGGVRCCQTSSNCVQDDCAIESCVSNMCQYSNRNACDSTECSSGTYCYNGDCTDGDNSEYVCINCAPDTTTGRWDWGAKIFEDAGKDYSRNTNVLTKLFDSNDASCPGSSCNKQGGCGCYDTISTSTLIKRKRSLTTGNCCGDDINEWYKKDYYGGECVSSVDQCVWADGNAQPGNSGNRQWWCNPGNWYECTDNSIGLGSPANPPPQGVCCAGIAGNNGWTPLPQVLPENQYSCTDGKDNDCDGKTDCDDIDCDGILKGYARSDSGNPISQADITAKKVLANFKTAFTGQQGTYSIPISCGTYNVVASHPDYGPETKGNVAILPNQQVEVNFTMQLGSSCEDDCTFVSDEIVKASCHEKNGCSFYDDRAKQVCDLSQPGWIRDYDNDNYIVCAEGSPQPKVEVEASVSCTSGTLIKVTRIVYYSGKPVKLVVAACG